MARDLHGVSVDRFEKSRPLFATDQKQGEQPVARPWILNSVSSTRPGFFQTGQTEHHCKVPGHWHSGRRVLRAEDDERDRGSAEDVTDEEIREAIRLLAESEGIFAETAERDRRCHQETYCCGQNSRRRFGRALYHG